MPDLAALSSLGTAYTQQNFNNTTNSTSGASRTGETSGTNTTQTTTGIGSNLSLDMTDFYTLLATQLQYQDADNPMDTSEMMSQLVQNQMSQSILQMTTAISDLTTVNLFSYASGMMGKEVTVAEVDDKGNYTGESLTGVVTGVSLGSMPTIVIDGKEYSLSQIMGVGDVPEPEENPDDGEGSGSGDNGDTGENTASV